MLTEKLAMLTLHLYAWFALDRNGFMKSCDPARWSKRNQMLYLGWIDFKLDTQRQIIKEFFKMTKQSKS